MGVAGASSATPPKNRLVIGLDFGTTNSGIAFCEQRSFETGGTNCIQIIQARRPNTKAKVYSLMKLDLDDEPLARLTGSLMRLKTDDKDEESGDDDKDDEGDTVMNDGHQPEKKDPVTLVADYLGKLREHAYSEIRKQYNERFDKIGKELIVTVPAVWSERAKDLTLKAVNRAGFDASRVALVTEPEAAAIYTLKGMSEASQDRNLKAGQTFVVCDAGGGTADLISYKITHAQPHFRVTKVEEAAVGNGDKCGAYFVMKEFQAWLRRWIGQKKYRLIPKKELRQGSTLMTDFETGMFSFTGMENNIEITLPRKCRTPNFKAKNIKDFVLSIKNHQIKEIFEPCIGHILKLIDQQIKAVQEARNDKPQMVFLVGGFGRNQYLYQRIRSHCKDQGIQTCHPMFPWSAIARGAVCRGLQTTSNGLLSFRLARKSYGTDFHQRWDPEKHHPDDRVSCKTRGELMACNQIEWFCKKGDKLPVDAPKTVTFSYETALKHHSVESRESCYTIFRCAGDEVPTRFCEGGSVEKCFRVNINLKNCPVWKMTKETNPLTGDTYYKVPFNLEGIFLDTEITWRASCHGEVLGTTVIYDT